QKIGTSPDLAVVGTDDPQIETGFARKHEVDLNDAQCSGERIDRFVRKFLGVDLVFLFGVSEELIVDVAGSKRRSFVEHRNRQAGSESGNKRAGGTHHVCPRVDGSFKSALGAKLVSRRSRGHNGQDPYLL